MNLTKIKSYRDRDAFIEEVKKHTYELEVKCHGCAQVIVQSFLDVLDIDAPAVSLAASPMAAGLALTGNNCGAVMGSLMILGMQYGRSNIYDGMDGIVKGIRPARRFIKYFQGKHGNINCRDITGTDLSNPENAKAYFDSGGLEKCANILSDAAGHVAGTLYDEMISYDK